MVGDLQPDKARQLQTISRKRFLALCGKLETEAKNAALKARCRTDRVLFASYFFGEKLNNPFSPFHLDCLTWEKIPFKDRTVGTKRARMGPRGNGKSEVYVKIEAIHDIVYEFETFIVILAESAGLARDRLREIKVELTENKRLKLFWGEDLTSDVWRVDDIETWNGIRVIAKSMASQVRGIKHPVTGDRPTKLIYDDAEDSSDVLNPELRARDWRIFTQDIEGASRPDGRTNSQMTGTPLHREALLPRLARTPGWDFRKYPAIKKWPTNGRLWERCRTIFSEGGFEVDDRGNLIGSSEGVELARRFYQSRKAAMDEGAEVLWPEGEPLWNLFVFLWTNGEAAFSKEKQLEPRDPGLATFDMSRAVRHTLKRDHILVHERDGTDRKVMLSDLQIVSFHDPAGADPKRKKRATEFGDYGCIVVIGVEHLPTGGRIGHVLAAWMTQVGGSSAQIDQAFALGEEWKVERHVLESDALKLLKESYRHEQRRRRDTGLWYQLPIYSYEEQQANKTARIASLEPAITNGWLTFRDELPMEFWNQWVDHPTADHDDGPDATHGAWKFARGGHKGLTIVTLD